MNFRDHNGSLMELYVPSVRNICLDNGSLLASLIVRREGGDA